MIVTVVIRRENFETSSAVSKSVPSKNTEAHISQAIVDAGMTAIGLAKDQGWLGDFATIIVPEVPAEWEPQVQATQAALRKFTGGDPNA